MSSTTGSDRGGAPRRTLVLERSGGERHADRRMRPAGVSPALPVQGRTRRAGRRMRPAGVPGAPPAQDRARRAGHVLWRIAGAVVLAWAVAAGWPQLRVAADALTRADHGTLLMALACQLAALALLSLAYRAALATAGAHVTFRRAGGVALRAAAVSRLLPGGGAAAALFAIRRLRRFGVADGPAVAGVTLNGLITMATLAALVATVGGVPARGATLWVAFGTLAAAALGVAVLRSSIRERLNVFAGRLRARPALAMWAASFDTLTGGSVRLRQLATAAGCAAAAWTCELAALWLAVAAVAEPLPFRAVALGLGAANAAAAVPHTPGGVGVVEVAMTAAFVAAGLDTGVALGGVLAYRAVGFWLPVAVGAGLLAFDALGHRRTRGDDGRPVAA